MRPCFGYATGYLVLIHLSVTYYIPVEGFSTKACGLLGGVGRFILRHWVLIVSSV